MLLADYEAEQNELELSVEALENSLNEYQENADNVDKFIELVRKFTDFTELTTPMIHEFVDKIVVHEADKSTGDRIQQIDIYLKYVGKLDLSLIHISFGSTVVRFQSFSFRLPSFCSPVAGSMSGMRFPSSSRA